jgi:hypothetical protein
MPSEARRAHYLIYKSKHGVHPFICVDKNWAVLGRFFQSLPVSCGVGDKQGRGRAARPRQPLWGPREVPFLLKKSLGKIRGPASNQTKIQFKKKNLFIIEHIKKTRIFLKKKKEKRT